MPDLIHSYLNLSDGIPIYVLQGVAYTNVALHNNVGGVYRTKLLRPPSPVDPPNIIVKCTVMHYRV